MAEENTNTITQQVGSEIERLASIDDFQIDLSQNYPEPKYTLFLHDTGTIPRGDLIAIKAKSKQGKSFLCCALISSMFGCSEFSFTNADVGKVLYFDTEQNERNTAKLVRRVHTLMNWQLDSNSPKFAAYALRTAELPKRLEVIKGAIKKHHPSAVFIDGVADLIDDFNSVEQSTKIINDLMELSATNDCAICCVLHENKKDDDTGMKGHLGTMLLQKASDVFQIKKDGYQFNVTETDCRNMPIEDFSFVVDGHGIPRRGVSNSESKQTAKENRIRKVMVECFATQSEQTYTELYQAYMLHGAVGQAQAKNCVRDAKEFGIIETIPSTSQYRLKSG